MILKLVFFLCFDSTRFESFIIFMISKVIKRKAVLKKSGGKQHSLIGNWGYLMCRGKFLGKTQTHPQLPGAKKITLSKIMDAVTKPSRLYYLLYLRLWAFFKLNKLRFLSLSKENNSRTYLYNTVNIEYSYPFKYWTVMYI